MVVITEKELKKRAEHNYGRLHNLEEVRTRCCCCCCGLGGGCGNLVDHIDDVVVVVVVVVHDNIIMYDVLQISLHQLHIQKIENLDKLCRDLKIIYLQVSHLQISFPPRIMMLLIQEISISY